MMTNRVIVSSSHGKRGITSPMVGRNDEETDATDIIELV